MTLVEYLRDNLGRPLDHAMAVQILILADGVNPIDLSRFAPHTYGDLVFHVERIADVLDEIRPLHIAHWQETEGYRHNVGLNPDYDGMMCSERQGRYILFTARRDGNLVGNCGVYFYRSRHTGKPFAQEDTLYLTPETRRGRNAAQFVSYAERILASLGATECRITTKLANRASHLMRYLGYKHIGDLLVKQLGGSHEIEPSF